MVGKTPGMLRLMQRRSERLSKYVEPEELKNKLNDFPEKRKRSEFYKIVSPSGVRIKNTNVASGMFDDLNPITSRTSFDDMVKYYQSKNGKK